VGFSFYFSRRDEGGNRYDQLELDDPEEHERSHSTGTNSTAANNSQTESVIDIHKTYSPEPLPDPLHLTDQKKSEEELQGTGKKVYKFYQAQNELIDAMLAPVVPMKEEDVQRQDLKVNIAIYGTAAASILLFCLELAAALLSGSLAIFATMSDGFMDLLSSAIIISTKYFSRETETYRYPSGKGRFETVGIVVFGSLMTTLSLQLIIHSIGALLGTPEPPDLGLWSIALVVVAIVIKLTLFIYCRLVDNLTAQAMSEDHRNDLFLNAFGIILAFLGTKVNSMIDPIGAILIAIFILCSWSHVVLKHCRLIVGKSADPNFIKRLTYIAMTHDERILQVDTCKAYHAGSKVIVEVDIVLPPETTLQVSHDLGESLQNKLELLPKVERAYVHVDYESTHTPEHHRELWEQHS